MKPVDNLIGKQSTIGYTLMQLYNEIGVYMPPIIEVKDIEKTYALDATEVHALRGITLSIESGAFISVCIVTGKQIGRAHV